MKTSKEITKAFIEWLLLFGHIIDGYDGPELDAPFDDLWLKFKSFPKPEEAEDE